MKAGEEGRRETAFFFPGYVRKRTEWVARKRDSPNYDARRRNLVGLAKRFAAAMNQPLTDAFRGLMTRRYT